MDLLLEKFFLGIHMLIHEYEGLGLFATAFCNGTVKNNSELEAKLNWQKVCLLPLNHRIIKIP
jgi:hypothetical protein